MSESNVVDLRPDRFLREMRDTGDFGKAAANANLTVADAEALCKENAKFDLAVIECHLEFLEEKMNEQRREALEKARAAHMNGHMLRHPPKVS